MACETYDANRKTKVMIQVFIGCGNVYLLICLCVDLFILPQIPMVIDADYKLDFRLTSCLL